ncbi:MAG TPA: uroporphyrinogen decarboxylase [Candidatus Omnitrophota bacterium]|nr:uroporphyrinogen decarboxylase [Candidatus Omnitrophota bacterium]
MKTDSLLLQTFEGKNKTIPVWFMRQAGRCLPEYRRIKERYSLEEMFHRPELAARVTCLPIDTLGVDAAILFADILTLPAQMGFQIRFDKNNGPIILNPLERLKDFQNIHDFADLSYVSETIKQVNQKLPGHIPLIGFAGSPFTVLCYLLEGGSSVSFNKTLRFMQEYPSVFQKLLTILTSNTIAYLNLQKKAGIKAFQLFDSWGGILRETDYERWALPYVQKIFKNVDLPSIYYLKNSSHLLSSMEKSGADFLSVCHTVDIGTNRILKKTKKGVQGNLFNGLLYADRRVLAKEIQNVLIGARQYKKYIFNLSHGVFPDTDVNTLKFIVERVHQFKWK